MAVMGSNPSSFVSSPPDYTGLVESITWHQAKDFVAALNHNAGDDYYRLPTEAEWELETIPPHRGIYTPKEA